MKLHHYDPRTGEHLASSDAFANPKHPGEYLNEPSTATTAPPPISPGQTNVWDGTAWQTVEDHRGREGYVEGIRTTITALGPLPEGWTDEPPPPPPPTLEEEKRAKIAAIDARTAELITAGFSFAGERFSMSEAAQRNWIALSGGLANGMLPFPLAVSTADESTHALASAEELRAFLGAYLLYQADPNQPLGSGRALKELAAAATTIGEVNAIIDDRE